MASNKKKVILSYYDSLIHESDLNLLDGPYWLNDTIIGFYIEYLEKEVLDGNNDISLIRPEITQCLKLSEISEYSIFLNPLNFKEKSFAIMPLNDCDNPDLPGGSHWSLLVYSKPEQTFFHLDSSRGSNHDAARRLSYKLSQYINKNKLCEFTTLSCLQQTNSYDCGVFVICNIDNVIPHILRHGELQNISIIKEYEVSKKRFEIKDLINTLARL